MDITAIPFSFRERPLPVPGDLRIGWRLALLLLMLGHSRSKRASIAKLHVLNNAVRFGRTKSELESLIAGQGHLWLWPIRVEPAFGRALDFLIGESLAKWTETSGRSALQLTDRGIAAWKVLEKQDDIMVEERALLESSAKQLTESAVSDFFEATRRRE